MRYQNVKAEIAFFDKITEGIDRCNSLSDASLHRIFPLITPYLKGRILEAGCGSGAFGLQIQKHFRCNMQLVGIDLNRKLLDLAKKNKVYKKNSAYCGNVENRHIFKKESFDTIICPFLMHHFPDMHTSINNFAYWLKPSGFLIIIDPNGSSWILKISYLLRKFMSKFMDVGWAGSINESHKSINEFIKCLDKFRIIKIQIFEFPKLPQRPSKIFSWYPLFVYLRELFEHINAKLPFITQKGHKLIIVAQRSNNNWEKPLQYTQISNEN